MCTRGQRARGSFRKCDHGNLASVLDQKGIECGVPESLPTPCPFPTQYPDSFFCTPQLSSVSCIDHYCSCLPQIRELKMASKHKAQKPEDARPVPSQRLHGMSLLTQSPHPYPWFLHCKMKRGWGGVGCGEQEMSLGRS